MNMDQCSDVWIGSSLCNFTALDALAFFQILKSHQKKSSILKAPLKAALCIKLTELRAGDVISHKLAAKLSYKSQMLGKPQQNESSKAMCPRNNNAIRGGVTALLHQHWNEPRWLFPEDVFESLLSSLKPLCVQCWHFSARVVLRIPVILTGENSLVVKQPFKTKCSVESELAAPLCAFFEMSADFKGGISDLLSFELLWCIFVASLGGFFWRFSAMQGLRVH